MCIHEDITWRTCFSIPVSSSMFSIAPMCLGHMIMGNDVLLQICLLVFSLFPSDNFFVVISTSSQMKVFDSYNHPIKLVILLEFVFNATINSGVDFCISQRTKSTFCSFLFSAWTWTGFLHWSIFLDSLSIRVGLMFSLKRT